MSRRKRLLIVVVAAVLYVPVAFGLLFLVAVLNWMFGLGMCDFDCGTSPDAPEQIAAAIEVVAFVVGLIAGAVWVMRGGSLKPHEE